MAKILMVVSAADSLTMKDGSEHPTGFWAEELVVAHQTLLGVTGSGKTFSIANVISQVQRPTLVLAPNTAVQGQWVAAWDAFGPPGEPHPRPGSSSRELLAPVTVLTYQSL